MAKRSYLKSPRGNGSFFLAIGSAFWAVQLLSCDDQPTQRDRSPAVAETCEDEEVDSTPKSNSKKASSKNLALQGTITGTGTATSTTTSTSTGTQTTTSTGTQTTTSTGTQTTTSTGTSTGTGTVRKVTYNDDMRAIFNATCATCHNTPPRKPFTSFSLVSAPDVRMDIMTRINGGSATAPMMPPMGTPQLTVEQKAKFNQWQSDGFLESQPPATGTNTPSPSTPAPTSIPSSQPDVLQPINEEDDQDMDEDSIKPKKKTKSSTDAKKKC